MRQNSNGVKVSSATTLIRILLIIIGFSTLSALFYGDYELYKIPGHLTLTLYSYVFFGMIIVTLVVYMMRQGKIYSEPYGQVAKFLKISLGILWLIDGILQLQPEMPYVFLPYVLQPTLSSSTPGVYNIVLFGYNIWAVHPVLYNAIASVIQLFLGVSLIMDLNRRGTLLVLVLSAVWSFVVWVFGEGFGGIFKAGSSFLSGLPGSALIYFFISVFLLLSILGWKIEKLIPPLMASIFIISFAFQVLPASDFWSGYSLSRIPYNLIFLNQPKFLAESFVYFTDSFIKYDFYWNILFSACFLLAAIFWIVRPYIASIASIPVIFFAWWVGQDFGIISGYGTDPNTGLPLLMICFSLLAYYFTNFDFKKIPVRNEELSSNP